MARRGLEEFLGALSREAGAEELAAADEDLLISAAEVVQELAIEERLGEGRELAGKLRRYAALLAEALLELRLSKMAARVSERGLAPQPSLPEELLVGGALERAASAGEVLGRALREGSPLAIHAARWESSREMAIIAVKQEIPAFRGVDLNSYGPFSPGDVAMVPRGDARALVSKGAAEEVVVLG